MSTPPVRINYLNNRDLLQEIHRSKLSYCYFLETKYANYDAIISSPSDITDELIQQVKIRCVNRSLLPQKGKPLCKPILSPDDVKTEDIVWRLMTYDHVPLDPTRSKNPKSEAERHKKTNFPPFKHLVLRNGSLLEVGRSHWIGGLQNGHFCQEHGSINRELAQMFMTLVDRYSQRSNWRGYTYVSEMKGQALLQLSLVGLQFDEGRSENPFAYFTVVTANAFTRVLNLEKRNQNIRDDILIMNGANPSITRQLDDQLQQKAKIAQEEGEDTIAVQEIKIPTTRRTRIADKVL